MLQFCWLWSQNAHLVNTIQIQNRLLCVACFGNMVMKWEVSVHWLTVLLRYHSNKASHILQTIWFFIVLTWWTFWDHCQQNWIIFYLFDPCRAKNLTFDLFFNNYETVRHRQVKLYFFWIVIMSLVNIEATFEFDPCTNYLVTPSPGFLYRMWPDSNLKSWSLDPYQYNEIIKPFVSFQLSKHCQRPAFLAHNHTTVVQTQVDFNRQVQTGSWTLMRYIWHDMTSFSLWLTFPA